MMRNTLPPLAFNKLLCGGISAIAYLFFEDTSKFSLPSFLNFLFTAKSYPSAHNLVWLNVNKIEIETVIVAKLQNTRYKCLSIQKAYVSTTIGVSNHSNALAVTLIASAPRCVEAHYQPVVFKQTKAETLKPGRVIEDNRL